MRQYTVVLDFPIGSKQEQCEVINLSADSFSLNDGDVEFFNKQGVLTDVFIRHSVRYVVSRFTD
jgi:hypothetical protein